MKKQIVVMFVVWLFTTCNLLDVNAQQFRDYVVEGDAIGQGVDESGRGLVQET